MLYADEFFVGVVANATPLSLVLPRNEDESTLLVGWHKGAPAAIFLSGEFRHYAFACENDHYRGGLIVPNIRLELDHSALYNSGNLGGASGSIIRRNSELVVKASVKGSPSIGVTLLEGLPPCAENHAVGFTRWQIVIGEGEDKRVLWKTADADGDAASAVAG